MMDISFSKAFKTPLAQVIAVVVVDKMGKNILKEFVENKSFVCLRFVVEIYQQASLIRQ